MTIKSGFRIEDILGKERRSNYQQNITLSGNRAGLFPFDHLSEQHKVPYGSHHHGSSLGFGSSKIAMPIPHKYNDKPMMLSLSGGSTPSHKQSFSTSAGPSSTGGFKPVSGGGGGWQIPPEKKGQVEGTRKSKPRKTQTVFSALQVQHLEQKYNSYNYISTEERQKIAHHLDMSVPQVKNWFQNKRNKERKMGRHPTRNGIQLNSPYGDYRLPHNLMSGRF